MVPISTLEHFGFVTGYTLFCEPPIYCGRLKTCSNIWFEYHEPHLVVGVVDGDVLVDVDLKDRKHLREIIKGIEFGIKT